LWFDRRRGAGSATDRPVNAGPLCAMGIDLTLFIMHVEDKFLIALPHDVSDAV